MAIDIKPQEFKVLSSHFAIRTRVERHKVTEQMLISAVGRMNLSAGDPFIVQCMDHEYETLYHEASYRVVQRSSDVVIKTVNFQPMQTEVINYSIEQVGDWWSAEQHSSKVGSKDTGLSMKWMLGRRAYVVSNADGKEVFATKDKDLARDIVSGDTPVPEAEAA